MNTYKLSSIGRHRPLEDFIFYKMELQNKHHWRLNANDDSHYLLDTPYTLSNDEYRILKQLFKTKAIASKLGNKRGIIYKESFIEQMAANQIGIPLEDFRRNLEIIQEILTLHHLETLYTPRG